MQNTYSETSEDRFYIYAKSAIGAADGQEEDSFSDWQQAVFGARRCEENFRDAGYPEAVVSIIDRQTGEHLHAGSEQPA